MERFTCCREVKMYLDFSKREYLFEERKRKKVLAHNLVRFTSKHYPRIFFDQRLSSIFFK